MNRDEFDIEAFIKILEQVDSACSNLNIDFFIIGSTSQNLWLIDNNKLSSGTKDFDFAVYVPDIIEYEKLKLKLQEDHGFAESSENAFCLISPDGVEIDLLPFGEISINEKVLIAGHGFTAINLDGFDEVYNHGTRAINIDGSRYRTATVPGIVILKLIAYDDRPQNRHKDINDIAQILEYYPELEMEFIWAEHNDLYKGDRGHQEVGLIVLGREMNKILEISEKLKNRVLNILQRTINLENGIIELLIKDPEREFISEKVKMMELLIKGINNNSEV